MKTDLEKFKELVKWFNELIFGTSVEKSNDIGEYIGLKRPKRARTKKGTYKADDKSTKDVNEAWVGGKSPKKKRKK